MSISNIQEMASSTVFFPPGIIPFDPFDFTKAPGPEPVSAPSQAPVLAPGPGPAPEVIPGGSSSRSLTALLIILIVIGFAILVALVVLIVRFRKFIKVAVLHAAEPKYDPDGGQPQQLQQGAQPLENHVVTIPPDPSPALEVESKQPKSPTGIPMPQTPKFLPLNGTAFFEYNASENPFSPRLSVSDLSQMCVFTYEELAVATNDFSEINLLGEGGFGYVHMGILRDGREVAVKQLKVGSSQGEREFQAEVEIITRIHHRHLVTLVGYCIAGSRRMLVYEFVPNKTLDFHLHGEGRPTMDWPTRLKIALGSAKGLAYLHEDCNPKIIHRDIKASNILLDFNFEAKVADFGLAKVLADAKTHVSTRVMGTFGYMAPEYASSGKLTDKSDVFSFGVVLLELITGRRAVISFESFMDESLVDWARPLLTRALEDGKYGNLVDPKLQKDYNPYEMGKMVACAAACVRHSAQLRPRMTQVVHALEKDILLDDPEDGVRSEHEMVNDSPGDLEYGSVQYNEHMKKLRDIALGSQENGDKD